MIKDTGCVYRRSVGKVSAHGQVEPHESIARLQDRHGHSHVGLRTRMRLDIRPAGSVYLLQAVYGQLFDLVHNNTATIIAFAGISFGIFIRADRAHGLHHFVGDVVFGCDEFEAALLAVPLFADQVENL